MWPISGQQTRKGQKELQWSPEVFFKKGVLKNFAKFTGKHLCQSLFLYLKPATLFKKDIWHWCFSVNFVKFLRTPFFCKTTLVAPSENNYNDQRWKFSMSFLYNPLLQLPSYYNHYYCFCWYYLDEVWCFVGVSWFWLWECVRCSKNCCLFFSQRISIYTAK